MFQIWSTVAAHDEMAGGIKPIRTGKIFWMHNKSINVHTWNAGIWFPDESIQGKDKASESRYKAWKTCREGTVEKIQDKKYIQNIN